MSISKEERGENWRTLEEWRGVYLAQKRAGHDKVYLEQSRYILDAADEHIGELQAENERLKQGLNAYPPPDSSGWTEAR